jgi:5-methylcytosine-specific restriction protein B
MRHVMTELGKILSEMYENAPRGDKVAMIHLFGIRYSSEIKSKIDKNNNMSNVLKEIIKKTRLKNGSSMDESYDREISKGLKLAQYVIDKKLLQRQ